MLYAVLLITVLFDRPHVARSVIRTVLRLSGWRLSIIKDQNLCKSELNIEMCFISIPIEECQILFATL